MNWNEIRATFLASPMIPEEIRKEYDAQCLHQIFPEYCSYSRFLGFMLGAEAMCKFLSSSFDDDLK